MCVLRCKWNQVRTAARRESTSSTSSSTSASSSPSIPSTPTVSEFSSLKGGHHHAQLLTTSILRKIKLYHRASSSSHSREPSPIVQPSLMEDGCHPYFPGTPWDQLELAPTVDIPNQPKQTKLNSIA